MLDKIKALCKRMEIPFPLPLGKDAVLSGSFMWNVLTTDHTSTWLPGDADIFCTPSAVPRLREFLHSHGFKLMYMKLYSYTKSESIVEEWAVPSAPDYTSDKDLCEYYNDLCDEYKMPLMPRGVKFAKKRGYATKGEFPCVQMIYSHSVPDLASLLISEQFDFPALENWFDGTCVHVNYPKYVETRTTTLREEFLPNENTAIPRKLRFDYRVDKYSTRYGLNILDTYEERPPYPIRYDVVDGVVAVDAETIPRVSAEMARKMVHNQLSGWPYSRKDPTISDVKRRITLAILQHISEEKYEFAIAVHPNLLKETIAWLRSMGYMVVHLPPDIGKSMSFPGLRDGIGLVVSWRDM